MNTHSQHADSLILNISLPCQWQSNTLSSTELQQLRQHTLDTLHQIHLLEHQSRELSEDDSEAMVHIHRLESKINMVMEVLTDFMASQQHIPKSQPLALSAVGLTWQPDEQPTAGEPILIDLYLCPRYPRPVVIPAIVESSDTDQCYAAFCFDSEQEKERLEQIIFLYHRRQIAETRRS